VISWLPTAHIAERAFGYYLPVLSGAAITTCANPREIIAVLPKVRPHFFFAVPRIWEKMKSGIEAQLAGLPAAQREPVEQAVRAAVEKVQLEQAGRPVPPELAARVAQADGEIFGPLRAMLGLDEAAVVGTGAAPTPQDVLEFFHGIGILLGEGWGMSETCGVGTVNPPGKVRLGTVGKPAPGIEIKLAADGEVLIRGDNIMVGYRNQPDKTAETMVEGGWLATGDIGEFDDGGYLRIVDRKKELIINAAGKNMSPANIEGTLKGGSSLIGQVCVIGDRRSYNTALLVLDPEYAAAWAKQHGIDAAGDALAGHPQVVAAVQAGVDAANAKLSRVEQVKKFTILPGDWPPGGDELTPTMKLKRKPIAAKYEAAIERMYAG
jgi:long-subunit acyl-CoA synthetase (AMP-forming)